MSKIVIEVLREADADAFAAHFERHRQESGQDGRHFMPFVPDDPDGPKGFPLESLERPLDALAWRRAWIAREGVDIVGSVDLAGPPIRAVSHRCRLAMGLEAAWRGKGVGRRLLDAALEFARATSGIDHVDLATFGDNAAALALYRSAGFEEIGRRRDAFRLAGQSIDDVEMTLDLRAVRPVETALLEDRRC